jgi:hypothetical protein
VEGPAHHRPGPLGPRLRRALQQLPGARRLRRRTRQRRRRHGHRGRDHRRRPGQGRSRHLPAHRPGHLQAAGQQHHLQHLRLGSQQGPADHRQARRGLQHPVRQRGEWAAKQEFAAKNNLLDFLKEDVKRAESRLAGEEREQLGAYLETFETLRNRQSRLNEIEHTLREKGPVVGDKYASAVETDRLDAQFDLGAAALVCGLTNVLTISSAAGVRDFDITFKGLGLNIDKHSIGHGGSYQGKTWADLYDIIRRYHFGRIAELCKKLEKVKATAPCSTTR